MPIDDRETLVCAQRGRNVPAVSVAAVVATYNRAHLVGKTLDSLLGQTRPIDQLIVVNDGSTDATRNVIESYGERVQYVETRNRGKSAALNTALPLVKTSHVWFFDDDDIALPEALGIHIGALTEYPHCDFTYSPHFHFSDEVSLEDIRASRALCFPDIDPSMFFIWMMEARFLPTHMQGMLIATRVMHEVGAFDETLLRSQDRDMVLRIARCARPCAIDTATWAMRRHDGARGPGFAQHEAADKFAAWWQYKPRIFRQLRADLGLHEYLPNNPLADTVAGDAALRRKALLQRAVIMATHGLFDEACQDLAHYAVESAASAGQNGNRNNARNLSFDYDKILMLTDVPASDCLPPPAFYFSLGQALAPNAGKMSRAIKGMVWSASRMRRKREYRSLAYTVAMGPVLLTGALAGRARRLRGNHA